MQFHKRAIFASVMGHALEYYDIMLYGFFTATIGPLFFPTTDPMTSRLLSLSSFAVGFIMRPVGSIVFGHLGDRLGRRKALMLSIFLVTVPTLGIGILPGYDQIGLWAPFLLILCRLLQGFCIGGELGGAMTFIAEHAQKGKAGLASSILEIGAYAGSLAGTALGFLSTLEGMPAWGWRIPFILGAFFGLLGFFIRSRLEETTTFVVMAKRKKLDRMPLVSLFKNHKSSMMMSLGICAGFIVPFYIITIYTNEIFKNTLHLSTAKIMGANAGLMCFWVGVLPIMGAVADRVGIRRLMTVASFILVILAYPLFSFAVTDPSFFKILMMQVLLSLPVIAYSAPFCGVLAFLYPPQDRYSGTGFPYALGAAIFGGMTPLTALSFVNLTGNPASPAILLILSGAAGFVAIVCARQVDKHLS